MLVLSSFYCRAPGCHTYMCIYVLYVYVHACDINVIFMTFLCIYALYMICMRIGHMLYVCVCDICAICMRSQHMYYVYATYVLYVCVCNTCATCMYMQHMCYMYVSAIHTCSTSFPAEFVNSVKSVLARNTRITSFFSIMDSVPTFPVVCPEPETIDNGNYTMSSTVAVPGTVVYYRCDNTYLVLGSGDLLRVCTTDGYWTGNTPSCSGNLF